MTQYSGTSEQGSLWAQRLIFSLVYKEVVPISEVKQYAKALA